MFWIRSSPRKDHTTVALHITGRKGRVITTSEGDLLSLSMGMYWDAPLPAVAFAPRLQRRTPLSFPLLEGLVRMRKHSCEYPQEVAYFKELECDELGYDRSSMVGPYGPVRPHYDAEQARRAALEDDDGGDDEDDHGEADDDDHDDDLEGDDEGDDDDDH